MNATPIEYIRLFLVILLVLYNLANGFLADDSQLQDYRRHHDDPILRGNFHNASWRILGSFGLLVPAVLSILYHQPYPGWAVNTSQLSYSVVIISMLAVGYNIRKLQRGTRS